MSSSAKPTSKTLADIQYDSKVDHFYSMLLLKVVSFILDGVFPSEFKSEDIKLKWVELIGTEEKPNKFFKLIKDKYISAGMFLDKVKVDKDLFLDIVNANIFAFPKKKIIYQPLTTVLSDRELIAIADALPVIEFDKEDSIWTCFTPDAVGYKDRIYYNILSMRAYEFPFPFFNKNNLINSPIKIKPGSVILSNTDKACGNYYIDHNNDEPVSNAMFIFFRQYLYLRLKLMFGESIAKLWSSWMKWEDGILQSTYKQPLILERLGSSKNRLKVFFEKTVSAAHYDKIYNEIEKRKLDFKVLSNGSLHFANLDEVKISIDTAKGLDPKSFAKSFYKLVLALKNVLVQMIDCCEDNEDYENKFEESDVDWLHEIKNSFLTELRIDSYNAKIYQNVERVTFENLADYKDPSIFEKFLNDAKMPYRLFYENFMRDTLFNAGWWYDRESVEAMTTLYSLFIKEVYSFLNDNQKISPLSNFNEYIDALQYECYYMDVDRLYKAFEDIYYIGKVFFSDGPIWAEDRTEETMVYRGHRLGVGLDHHDPIFFYQLIINFLFIFPDLKILELKHLNKPMSNILF